MRTLAPRLVVVLSIVLPLTLAGCTSVGLSPATPTGALANATFDQQFIDMMVPHHEGAIAMAQVALQRAERPEVKALAEGIVRSQGAEIQQLKSWRKAWFGSDQTPPLSQVPTLPGLAGHGGHGATMDLAADVAALRAAPEPFDRACIDAMVAHHESAIAAAQAAETRAERPEINELARRIAADQQREVEQLKRWRQVWYGSAESQS